MVQQPPKATRTDTPVPSTTLYRARMPARSRCEIHYGGQLIYAVVMWAEHDRMGVRCPYELTHGALYNALQSARSAAMIEPARIFQSNRPAVFGRRRLS